MNSSPIEPVAAGHAVTDDLALLAAATLLAVTMLVGALPDAGPVMTRRSRRRSHQVPTSQVGGPS